MQGEKVKRKRRDATISFAAFSEGHGAIQCLLHWSPENRSQQSPAFVALGRIQASWQGSPPATARAYRPSPSSMQEDGEREAVQAGMADAIRASMQTRRSEFIEKDESDTMFDDVRRRLKRK